MGWEPANLRSVQRLFEVNYIVRYTTTKLSVHPYGDSELHILAQNNEVMRILTVACTIRRHLYDETTQQNISIQFTMNLETIFDVALHVGSFLADQLITRP